MYYRMSAKSTEKIPSCPSERCFEDDDGVLAECEMFASSPLVEFMASVGVVLEGEVSGKRRFRLAATVSGLQWRKSLPVPQSLVEEEDVGDVRGEAVSSSEASGL